MDFSMVMEFNLFFYFYKIKTSVFKKTLRNTSTEVLFYVKSI